MNWRNGHQLIAVPGGPFLMGSDEFEQEQPLRRVVVPSFLIDRYPVTNGQFAAYVAVTGASGPTDWTDGTPPADRLDHPVEQISFSQAQGLPPGWV